MAAAAHAVIAKPFITPAFLVTPRDNVAAFQAAPAKNAEVMAVADHARPVAHLMKPATTGLVCAFRAAPAKNAGVMAAADHAGIAKRSITPAFLVIPPDNVGAIQIVQANNAGAMAVAGHAGAAPLMKPVKAALVLVRLIAQAKNVAIMAAVDHAAIVTLIRLIGPVTVQANARLSNLYEPTD
jgi:hypothetical protein